MTAKWQLNTTARVRREMARVYRLAAGGELLPREMAQLIYGLKNIAEVIFMVEYEKRLDALEAREKDARAYIPKSSDDLLLIAQEVNGEEQAHAPE